MQKEQTAMQQLKHKIQVAIGDLDTNYNENQYRSGYKQCLINIQNDIDAQMFAIERMQINNAYIAGSNDMELVPSVENYYKSTFDNSVMS
jgi:hypothetical protein